MCKFLYTADMVEDQPLSPEMRAEIAGSLAELDPVQMNIIAAMTPAQRVAHALSMSDSVLQVAIHRLRQSKPHLSIAEARREALAAIYERHPSTYLPR